MKLLHLKGFDSAALLDTCINQLQAQNDIARFVAARADLLEGYQRYVEMAGQRKLFSAKECLYGKDEQIICGALSKLDLTELYSNVMLAKGGPARKVYDQLMALPPLSNCPYCGIGQVFTLDHFLSKSRYPQFSVLCENLVACCETCNRKMGGGVTTAESIAVHPYFEEPAIEGAIWLTATLIETAPPSVTFHVAPVVAWSPELSTRVQNHFGQLGLAARYAVAAANELASNVEIFEVIGSPEDVGSHLAKYAEGLTKYSPNSWRAALYRALAESDWYINGGYASRSPGVGLGPAA